jgi:hypothetical protein
MHVTLPLCSAAFFFLLAPSCWLYAQEVGIFEPTAHAVQSSAVRLAPLLHEWRRWHGVYPSDVGQLGWERLERAALLPLHRLQYESLFVTRLSDETNLPVQPPQPVSVFRLHGPGGTFVSEMDMWVAHGKHINTCAWMSRRGLDTYRTCRA